MKKFKTLILLLLCSFALKGQSNFNQVWDSLYRDIKHPGSMNTGYFWNLGIIDSTIYENQGLRTDSLSNFDRLSNLYQQFYHSSIQMQQNIPEYEQFQKNLEYQFKEQKHVIPILFLSAGMLNESAYKEGSIQFDSAAFKWVVNRPQEAFKLQDVFIAAPYVPVCFTPQINILIGDEFIVNNSGMIIKRIQIKFRNETYQDVVMNTAMTFVLLPGENEVTIQVSFMDGKIRESKTLISFETRDLNSGVSNKHVANNPFHFGDATGTIYADPDRETELQEPLAAFIDYLPGFTNGKQNTCIGKPIVIVEGIDFGYKDHWTGCYGGKCGSTGLIDLVNGYLFNPYEAKEKKRIEPWSAIEKAPQFLNELRNKGYDIFYVDFHNGADYMENNAMLVVKFIQMLNERKCSNEEIVVVGTSMGGIVAKYALSYMEKHNMPHCVRTYLSFDAPHQGANIPYGLQNFMQYYSGKLPTMKENFKRKLDRAATRQLLSMHVLSDVNTTPHKDRNDFLIKQDLIGNYPKLSRNIALSNGSVDASFQNFKPGDLLLSMNPISANLDNNPINFTAYVFAMSNLFQEKTWSKPINIAFYAMLPLGIKHFVPIDKEFGYDHHPGSLRYDLRDFRKIYGLFNIINNHSSNCFIPTWSSLDVSSKVGQKIDDYVDRFVPNPTVYPFHTYYGVVNTNQEHMQLTDDNIKWMVDEIEKNANEIGPILSTTYNFGRYERKTLPSVIVQSQGKLQINAHGLNGFGAGTYDRMNRKGSTFEIRTSECNSLVLIDQGGILELGSDNTENNKAILRIKKGCTLMLKTGSTLLVHDNSQLIIEEGAQLIYFPGANIQLEGNEATLQIDGKLRLETNAVFSISKGNSSNTGYVKFRNAKGGYGEGVVEIGGINTRIALKGTGQNNDVVLQIEGEMNLVSSIGLYKLEGFTLENCKVLYGNRSSIKLDTKLKVNHVVFDKLPWATFYSSDALILLDIEDGEIQNSRFLNFNFGVKSLGSRGKNNALIVGHTNFENCENAFYATESKLDIQYCVYNSNIENGIYVQNGESDLYIVNTSFNNNSKAVYSENNTGQIRYAFIESCDFGKNIIGLELNNMQTALSCSRFIGNSTGVKDQNGSLNLSADQTMIGESYQCAGGNNTFAYNSSSSILVLGTVLYLDNGKNNFIHNPGNSACNFVLGEVAYTQATHESNSPYKFKASNNYWKEKPLNNNLSNGTMSMYFVKFPYPFSKSSTLNYFTGDLLSDINKTCYNESSCNPCAAVLNGELNNKEQDKGQADSTLINIYPFPANDFIELELPFEKAKVMTMKLIDLEGRVLFEGILSESKTRIQTSEFANGIYILELGSSNRKIQKRILINHAW